MTFAFAILVGFCALSIAGAAKICSGRSERMVVKGGLIFWSLVLSAIEVTAAFYMANATGSNLVLGAAWTTLVLDLIGIVVVSLNYKATYNPYLWYEWLMIILNIALVVLYTHAYMVAS